MKRWFSKISRLLSLSVGIFQAAILRYEMTLIKIPSVEIILYAEVVRIGVLPIGRIVIVEPRIGLM